MAAAEAPERKATLHRSISTELPFEDEVFASKSDVTLITSDQHHVHAHRLVLSLWSKVFNDMFVDTEGAQVHVDDSYEDLTLLLRALYPVAEEVEATMDNVERLVVMADKYNVPMLLRKCEKCLIANVLPRLSALGNPATKAYGLPLSDPDAQGGALKWLLKAQRYQMREFGVAVAAMMGKHCRKWYLQKNPCLTLVTDVEFLQTMLRSIDLR